MIKQLDINADVGEGVGNESALLPLITSCNIACGGHAGDATTIRSVIQLAKQYEVKIGAHPSFPDKENFGRSVVTLSRKQLQHTLTQQIENLRTIAQSESANLHHVKPHGALYNLAAKNADTATTIVETIKSIDDTLVLYVPYGSVISEIAKGTLRTATEAFADRAYNEDYNLVSRNTTGAVLHNIDAVKRHVSNLFHKQLVTLEGTVLPFDFDTLCVHGDTPEALEIVKAIRDVANTHHIPLV